MLELEGRADTRTDSNDDVKKVEEDYNDGDDLFWEIKIHTRQPQVVVVNIIFASVQAAPHIINRLLYQPVVFYNIIIIKCK